ncbi:MAG: 4-alpha-glucanotransferase [Alphaproteobacteria bacterium]|nr:4-alpha-glucanotransferase [Alphaproteobacteria bacterium]
MYQEKLEELSLKAGILPQYNDPSTQKPILTTETVKKEALLALGYKSSSLEEVEESLKKIDRFKMPSFLSFKEEEAKAGIQIPFFIPTLSKIHTICVFLSDKKIQTIDLKEIPFKDQEEGKLYTFFIQHSFAMGYHTLSFYEQENGKEGALINKIEVAVAPLEAYCPSYLSKRKSIGVPLQLYALKSDKNWGIGDFEDLKEYSLKCLAKKVDLIGVNPLSALFLDSPEEASPYFASHRLFLNPLYISIENVQEYKESSELKEKFSAKPFQEELEKLRQSPLVLYKEVSAKKLLALDDLFKVFYTQNFVFGRTFTKRGREFLSFCEEKGEELTAFALYQVMMHFYPSFFKRKIHFESKEAQGLLREYEKEILKVKYIQFIAFEQLEEFQKIFPEEKGFYFDLAVGAAKESAEQFYRPSLYIQEAQIGSPPDFFNPKGQNWGLSALSPQKMKESRFLLFRKLLSTYMRYSKAIRIDHIFSFERLFLQFPSGEGCYLNYPSQDLFNIAVLESHLNKCMIIGEDLGTSPPNFYQRTQERKIFSFRLFLYQKKGAEFLPSNAYDAFSALTTGTHDMPTFAAYWQNKDLELLFKMGRKSQEDVLKEEEQRKKERGALFSVLAQNGLFLKGIENEDLEGKRIHPLLIKKIYEFLLQTNSQILLIRIEDICHQVKQMNLPGTNKEYPNWRYKLFFSNKDFNEFFQALL